MLMHLLDFNVMDIHYDVTTFDYIIQMMSPLHLINLPSTTYITLFTCCVYITNHYDCQYS